ncbi:MAG: peptide chain release factor N(5)-glutamine methyltransferase [Xanthobacteraceae bacterium]
MKHVPGLEPGMGVDEARRLLSRILRAKEIDSPELDARILVGHALGLDHAALAAAPQRRLTDSEARAIGVLAMRRLEREPIARIVGTKEFWGLALNITSATLVPRPESETVVEAALASIDGRGSRTAPYRIADLGTGSGALLLALLSELPQAFGVGTDVSIAALITARHNAARLHHRARSAFVASDFGCALAGGFDLVVSNPPYIASSEIGALAADVRDYDPRLALDGGPDGLAAYRCIAADAQHLLAQGGHLIVELARGQADAVATLFARAGLKIAIIRNDLAGIPRALVAHAVDAGARADP